MANLLAILNGKYDLRSNSRNLLQRLTPRSGSGGVSVLTPRQRVSVLCRMGRRTVLVRHAPSTVISKL